jgi:hypothetical protein
MWVIFLEAGLALLLLLVIVCATWPRRRNDGPAGDNNDTDRES